MSSRGVLRALLVGLLLSLAARARADDVDEARSRQAQALFDRARDLLASGDVDQACALLAESQRLDPGGGTLLNLAVCHEKQGRLATAWTEYHDARSAALRDDRRDRQALASERIRVIEERVPHLIVSLPPHLPEGASVTLDGEPLARLVAGTPLPVDPGPHEVLAYAPGRPPWTIRVEAAADGKSIEVHIPEFSALMNAPAPPSVHKKLATGSYVVGGIALTAFATMAITGALALSEQSSAEATCVAGRDYCTDPNAGSEASTARALAWTSTIALGTALAATVVAVVWPRKRVEDKPAPEPPALGASATGGGVGFVF